LVSNRKTNFTRHKVDTPPSLKELLSLEFPQLTLQKIKEDGTPPIGTDDEVDMRFFPARRPAADAILKKLRKLTNVNNVTEIMLIAVSGAGKTSTIFQVARDIFTIYIPCTPNAVYEEQKGRLGRDNSGSFVLLENAVNKTVPKKESAFEKSDEAIRLSTIFFVANLFGLFLFLKSFLPSHPFSFCCFI